LGEAFREVKPEAIHFKLVEPIRICPIHQILHLPSLVVGIIKDIVRMFCSGIEPVISGCDGC